MNRLDGIFNTEQSTQQIKSNQLTFTGKLLLGLTGNHFLHIHQYYYYYIEDGKFDKNPLRIFFCRWYSCWYYNYMCTIR